MKRSAPLRRAPLTPRAKPLSPGSPRSHADALLEKLGNTLYSFPEWGLVTEVRNHAGPGAPEVLRRADAIARDFYPLAGRARFHFFEGKTSRKDWTRELKNPEKRGPFELFCSACYLVVPAPYKSVIVTTRELPDRWGLIEVGTGDPRRIIVAEERDAEEPTEGFQLALFRAALAQRDRAQAPDAPLSPIVRLVGPRQAQLGCGHLVLVPLLKTLPRALPCFSCAAGLPVDDLVVKEAFKQASPEKRREYLELLRELEGVRKCGCNDSHPVLCMTAQLEALGALLTREEAARIAISKPCLCHCHGDER